MIRVIKGSAQLSKFLDLLKNRAEGVDDEILKRVSDILHNINERGDAALHEYTERFDNLRVDQLRITDSEIRAFSGKTPPDVVNALKSAAARIRKFHLRQVEQSWTLKKKGEMLGQLILPIHRIGVYVPGGTASYPSTVLMNVIPAQVAGVKEIALCVPTPMGEINPSVMSAIRLLGLREVYRVGGAQAIGAMAYGTETIRKVDKIVGPGNIYVATAKKMVFGTVDIDMIAGPSEVMVIADRKAPPHFIASDLLSQAEHDELASSILVTSSERLAVRVKEELMNQLKTLKRKKIARSSLKNYGAIIITNSLKESVRIANEIAPEHLEIMTDQPEKLIPLVRNAGAIFLGMWTPEPLGDYAAGPNHTLPTGGTARFSSPLGTYDFIKRSSILKFDREAFEKLSPVVEILSGIEGLEAHGRTIRVRKVQGR
jgi:histidinol dehydrogenase